MLCCPEKDLISVYIDGELPEKFKAEFEEHLKNCPDCEKTYKAFLRQKEFFTKDAKQFNLDAIYMEQAYSRLQARMSFSKVRSKNKNIIPFSAGFLGRGTISRAIVSAAAAAAVFAMIFIPVYKTANAKNEVSEIKTIARTEFKPVSEKGIVVDENIAKKENVLSAVASVASAANSSATEDSEKDENSELLESLNSSQTVNPNQKVVSAAVASFGDSISNMSSIDVFRPEFVQERYPTIKFSITIDSNLMEN